MYTQPLGQEAILHSAEAHVYVVEGVAHRHDAEVQTLQLLHRLQLLPLQPGYEPRTKSHNQPLLSKLKRAHVSAFMCLCSVCACVYRWYPFWHLLVGCCMSVVCRERIETTSRSGDSVPHSETPCSVELPLHKAFVICLKKVAEDHGMTKLIEDGQRVFLGTSSVSV